MKTRQMKSSRCLHPVCSGLGEVVHSVPAAEYHFWQMELINPFRQKVERVKKRGKGSATRRELEKACLMFKGRWIESELRELLNTLNTDSQANR